MTEEEARIWCAAQFHPERVMSLVQFADMVVAESAHQNLIARSTIDQIWGRHVVDSAQLVHLASDVRDGLWLDIGTGAGFPGIVVALLTDREMLLVEPRKRRAAFLVEACARLGINNRVTVIAARIETVAQKAAIISARAVSLLPDIFTAAQQCATIDSLWLMPKGRGAREEMALAKRAWHGSFHVEHSLTDPESLIVLARKVSRK